MNENSTPIKALKIERQKWHQGMVLARKGKYALSEKELKLFVDEYNACDKAIKTLQADVIAEGKVIVRENYSGIRDIYVEGKKQCVFYDDLPNILLPLENQNIKITISKIGDI